MITIGIRAQPKGLTFAIFDKDANIVLNVEDIKIPAAFTVPEGLKYLRSNLLDVLREYSVARAGVRAFHIGTPARPQGSYKAYVDVDLVRVDRPQDSWLTRRVQQRDGNARHGGPLQPTATP